MRIRHLKLYQSGGGSGGNIVVKSPADQTKAGVLIKDGGVQYHGYWKQTDKP